MCLFDSLIKTGEKSFILFQIVHQAPSLWDILFSFILFCILNFLLVSIVEKVENYPQLGFKPTIRPTIWTVLSKLGILFNLNQLLLSIVVVVVVVVVVGPLQSCLTMGAARQK